jgi:hypothetical protein
VTNTAIELLGTWLAAQPGAAVRLLGVGVGDLEAAMQMNLFAAPESSRNKRVDAAVDRVRERFGNVALRPASSLGHAGTATQSTLGARVDQQRPGGDTPGRGSPTGQKPGNARQPAPDEFDLD